jgi:hypothetical protein
MELPKPLRRALEVWYLHGGTINEKRKMLRCRREAMLELLDQARILIVNRVYGSQFENSSEDRRVWCEKRL